MIRNLYIMPKIYPDKEWCEHECFEFELDAEYVVNKTSYSYGGNYNYGAVTNAPSTEYINYTQYANYGRSVYEPNNTYGYSNLDAPDAGMEGKIYLI
jgi:hypothetical protein